MDPDNDRDGIPDVVDLARDEPESVNFFEDQDGRPDRLPPALARSLSSLQRLRSLHRRLTESSEVLVDPVAAALETWPEVRIRLTLAYADPAAGWDRGPVVVGRIVGAGIGMERVELQVVAGRRQISLGFLWVCGIRTDLDDSLMCLDDTTGTEVSLPDLPDGRFIDVCSTDLEGCALDEFGEPACWSYDPALDSLAYPPPGPFVSITCGAGHACALTADGRIECWGDDYYGETIPPS